MPERMRWHSRFVVKGSPPFALEDLFYAGNGGATWFHGYAKEYDSAEVAKRVAGNLRDADGWRRLQIFMRLKPGVLKSIAYLED